MMLRVLILLVLTLLGVRAEAQAVPATAPAEPAPPPTTATTPEAKNPPAAPPADVGTLQPADVAVPPAELTEDSAAASASDPNASTGALLSASELEALGLGPESSGVDTDFHFSGFADFTAWFPIKPRGSTATLGTYQSFYVGNVNLYVSKNLSESFRMMGEVRLSYLPNGSLARNGTGFDYQQAQALDYADSNRETRWGAIIMQRVYLEWTLHRLATVRIGQFLTPYGIWNVDHGSPAYIPVQRPYAINHGYFPERQTGLEAFGRWDASNRSTLGYHVTLSNGTGPISEYRDLDKNKAVGARAYWEHRSAAFFRLGVSGYYGTDTYSTPVIKLAADHTEYKDKINSQYDSLALAVDVLLKIRGLHLQAEWVSQQRRYTRKGRTSHDVYLGPVAKGYSADSLSWAGYALAAYQFNWYALTPYLMGEYVNEVLINTVTDITLKPVIVHGGINVHPIDAVTFKCEYAHATFLDGGALFKDPYSTFQVQGAWAF